MICVILACQYCSYPISCLTNQPTVCGCGARYMIGQEGFSLPVLVAAPEGEKPPEGEEVKPEIVVPKSGLILPGALGRGRR